MLLHLFSSREQQRLFEDMGYEWTPPEERARERRPIDIL